MVQLSLDTFITQSHEERYQTTN